MDRFDILIQNGKIVNGTGNPWFYGDVGIKNNTIVAVGDLSGKAADTVIDADGLVVAPGFIDLHTHCDQALGDPGSNTNLNCLIQGTTTQDEVSEAIANALKINDCLFLQP